jgi:hypothetical protein
LTRYEVRLEVRFNGSPWSSTRDVVEADTAEQAEADAIAAWEAAEADPRFSYRPLITIAVHE